MGFFFFFQSVKEKLMNVDHSTYLWKSKVMEQPLLGVYNWIIKGKEAWFMRGGGFLPNLGGGWNLGSVHNADVGPQSQLHPEECVVYNEGFTLGLGAPAPGSFPCLTLAQFFSILWFYKQGINNGLGWNEDKSVLFPFGRLHGGLPDS